MTLGSPGTGRGSQPRTNITMTQLAELGSGSKLRHRLRTYKLGGVDQPANRNNIVTRQRMFRHVQQQLSEPVGHPRRDLSQRAIHTISIHPKTPQYEHMFVNTVQRNSSVLQQPLNRPASPQRPAQHTIPPQDNRCPTSATPNDSHTQAEPAVTSFGDRPGEC